MSLNGSMYRPGYESVSTDAFIWAIALRCMPRPERDVCDWLQAAQEVPRLFVLAEEIDLFFATLGAGAARRQAAWETWAGTEPVEIEVDGALLRVYMMTMWFLPLSQELEDADVYPSIDAECPLRRFLP